MNAKATKYIFFSAALGPAAIPFPALLRAKAPPGPINPSPSTDDSQPTAHPKREAPEQHQPPATRANLNGSWKLNSDQSDDGREKVREAKNAQTNGNGGNGGNGGSGRSGGGVGFPGGGVGFPGSGGGGGVYGRHGAGNGSDIESADDRAHTQELIDPPVTIHLAQKENEFDLADDSGNKREFYTDGRKLTKSKDLSDQEIAAHWEDIRLVSDEKTSHGNRISRTFEPQPGGKKLVETVRIESNRNQSAVEIRYVYDLVPQDKS